MNNLLSKKDLLTVLENGQKAPSLHRIGVEHEKFIFTSENLRAPYKEGIEDLLWNLSKKNGTAVMEKQSIIGLLQGKASLSLEPGGQFELSGAPLDSIHSIFEEITQHLSDLKSLIAPKGMTLVGMGTDPLSLRKDIPWMPKGRYAIMGPYMETKGLHGLDMMTGTSTVQVNLDYTCEADMVKKIRVSMALQPFVTALFANSPFFQGKDTGYQSFRRHIWHYTDPDRTGLLPFVFDQDMGFERYVDYALDVPMYFIYRDGYINKTDTSFRDFMKNTSDPATLGDWEDHLTTLFPEVRLKSYIEMRGADAGLIPHLMALPALWVGLLYDEGILDALWKEIKTWPLEDILILDKAVPLTGIHGSFQGKPLMEPLKRILAASKKGLKNRRIFNSSGQDESLYLEYLENILDTKCSAADRARDLYLRTKDWTAVLKEASF